MSDEDEDIVRVWDQQPGEGDIWYRIFTKYYLPLGQKRNLRTAFEYYLRMEKPIDYIDVDPDNFKNIPAHWTQHAFKFEWAKRALEFDQASAPDFSMLQVSQTLEFLREHAMKAAYALVESLTNERTRVQAANSILNRSGIPEVSEVNLKSAVSITADEMAAAQEKVTEWMTQKKSG